MTLTDAEFQARTQQVLEEESHQPERWMWLSFADQKFLGGVVIKAHGLLHARLIEMPRFNIQSPGGEIASWTLPDELVPPESYRNRLLTEAEVYEMWPDSAKLSELED